MGKSAPIRWAARGYAPRESKVTEEVVNVYKWLSSSRGCSCSRMCINCVVVVVVVVVAVVMVGFEIA